MQDYLWKYWRRKLEKIERQMFNSKEYKTLFNEDLINLQEDLQKEKISDSEFSKLSTDLKRAYTSSYNNYRKHKNENRFWKKIVINLKSFFSLG